jgi:hypothetical protein
VFRRFFRIGFGGCGCALEEHFRGHARVLFDNALTKHYDELNEWKEGLSNNYTLEMNQLNQLQLKHTIDEKNIRDQLDTIRTSLDKWGKSLAKTEGKWMPYEEDIVKDIKGYIKAMYEEVEDIQERGFVLFESLRVDSVGKKEATEKAHAHLYNRHIVETRDMIVNDFGKEIMDSEGFNHRPELQLLCLSIKEVRNEVFKDINKAIKEKEHEASKGYFFFVGFGGGTGTGVISPIAQRIGVGVRGYVALGMLSGDNDEKYLQPQQKWFRRCFNTLLALNDLKTTGELTGIILVDNDIIIKRTEGLTQLPSTSENEELKKNNADRIDMEIIKAIYPAFGETSFDDPNFGRDWSGIGKNVGSKSQFFVPCYANGKKDTIDLIDDAMKNELVGCNDKEKNADKIFVFTRKVGDNEEVEKKLKDTFCNTKNVAIIEKSGPPREMVIDNDMLKTLESKSIPDDLKDNIKKLVNIPEKLSFEVEVIEKSTKWLIKANKENESESKVQYQYSINTTKNKSLFSIPKQTGAQRRVRGKPNTVFQNLEEGEMEDKKKKKELLKIFRDNKISMPRNPNIVFSSINDGGSKSWKITISEDSSNEKTYIIEDAKKEQNIYEKGRLKLVISKIGEGSIEDKFKSDIIVIETGEIGINDKNENEVLMLLRVPDSSISSLKKRLEVAKKFVDVLDMVVRWVDGSPQKSLSINGDITIERVVEENRKQFSQNFDHIDYIGQNDGKKWIGCDGENIYFFLKKVHSLDIYSRKKNEIEKIVGTQFLEDGLQDIKGDANKKIKEILKEALLFLFPEDIPEEMVMENYKGRMKGIVKNLKKEMGVIGRIDVSNDKYSKFKKELENRTVQGELENKCKEKSSRESGGEQGEGDEEYRVREIDKNLYDICKSTGGLPFLFENPIFDLKSASASSNEVMLTSILAMDEIAYNKFRRVIGEEKFNDFFRSFINEKLKNRPKIADNCDGGKEYSLNDEGVEILQQLGLRDTIDHVSSYVEIKSESDALTLLDVMGGIESFFKDGKDIRKADTEEYDFIEILAFSALYAAQRRLLFSWDEKDSDHLFNFSGISSDTEQKLFCEHLGIISSQISQLIKDAEYSRDGDNLINITKNGKEIVATLQIENDLCYFKLKNGVAIKIGVVKDNGNIYTANREDKLKWYLKEDLKVDWVKNNVEIEVKENEMICIPEPGDSSPEPGDSSKKIKILIDKTKNKAILNIRAGKSLSNMDAKGITNGDDILQKVKTELNLSDNYGWEKLQLETEYMINNNDRMGRNYHVRVENGKLKISEDRIIELNVVKKGEKYLVYKGIKEV